VTPACLPRSPDTLRAVVGALDVERNEKYRKRDVTGDGKPETWCNLFVADASAALGVPVPALLANDMVAWLDGTPGAEAGWGRVTAHEAEVLAGQGHPVVVGWANPRGHGHVAIAVPTPEGASGLHVAQAGAINFSCRPVARGFGGVDFTCWGHD